MIIYIGRSDNNLCRFCGPDSLEHRHWKCESTAAFRAHLTDDQLEYASTLPECARERAWFPEISEVSDFKRKLLKIPDSTREWEHVLTDGTAMDPAIPMVRLAAWSVVLATSHQFLPLSTGGLPGQWQTVLRAEITAVISALEWSQGKGINIRIWCDNDTVVKRFRRFQRHHTWVKSTAPDHDLWNRMMTALANHAGQCVTIKVDSHQDMTIADHFQTWAFNGNTAADNLAGLAISHIPTNVVASQKAASKATQKAQAYNGILLDMYAKIGLFAVTNKAPDQPKEVTVTPQLVDPSRVISFAPIASVAVNAPAKLQVQGFHKIVGLHSLDDPDPAAKIYAVTWLELMWSFQSSTNICSVVSKGCHGQWSVQDLRQTYDILKESHSFANYVIAFAKLVYPDFKPLNAKPSNYGYQHWAMCIYFRWNETDRNAVMTWLQSTIGSRQVRTKHRGVTDIPLAFVEVAPLVQTPQAGLHWFFK